MAAAAVPLAALVAHGDSSLAALARHSQGRHLVHPGLPKLLGAAAGTPAGSVTLLLP